ncbi:amidohydrolase family protein, partial [Nocardia sp. NPDC004722]
PYPGGVMARIDVHAHLFPIAYLDVLDRARGSSEGTAAVRGTGPGATAGEVADRIGLMDQADIEVQLLSVAPQFPHFEDRDRAVEAARVANDELAAVVRAHPERFRALAVTPAPHTVDAVAEARRAIEDLGFAGVAISAFVLGRSLAEDWFEPVLSYLDDREAVLFVHPAGDGIDSAQLAPLGWVIGHAVELSLAALQLIQKDLVVKYPRVRFLFPHMCGFLPFQAQRLDLHADWYLPPQHTPVSEQLTRLHYDTANPTPGALEQAVGIVGASQFMIGTDFPFETGDSFFHHATYVGKTGLPAAQVEAIESANARRLLGL